MFIKFLDIFIFFSKENILKTTNYYLSTLTYVNCRLFKGMLVTHQQPVNDLFYYFMSILHVGSSDWDMIQITLSLPVQF